MAKPQITGNTATFTVNLPVEDYQALLLHEEPGRNFRQLSQAVIRDFLARSPRVQAARAEADDRRAENAFAQIESAMAIFQPETQIDSATV